MILLCGGEGAAGGKAGGVFFLLVSYAGPDGRRGHRGVDEAARAHAARNLQGDERALWTRGRGSDR